MNCTICGKPIELIPSASQRAEKFGGTAADYTRLFTEHAMCTLQQRAQHTSNLLKQAR